MTGELTFAGRLVSLALSKEKPPTIALVLSHLDPWLAAAVVNTLSEEIQGDVIHSVARFESDSARASKAIDRTARRKLKVLLKEYGFTHIGGPRVAAEIMRRVDRPTEAAVMAHLAEEDAEIAEAVRSHLIAFEDIAWLTGREIQMILREADMKDLAVALKGGSQNLEDRVFSSMGEEAAGKIKEEMDLTGPVRESDRCPCSSRIVQVMRQLEDAGQISPVRCSQEPFV